MMEINTRQFVILASVLGMFVGATASNWLANRSPAVVYQTIDSVNYQQLHNRVDEIHSVLTQLKADISQIASSSYASSLSPEKEQQLMTQIREEITQFLMAAQNQYVNSNQLAEEAALDDRSSQNARENEEVAQRIIDSFSSGTPLYDSLQELMDSQEMHDLSLDSQKQVVSAVVMMMNSAYIDADTFIEQ